MLNPPHFDRNSYRRGAYELIQIRFGLVATLVIYLALGRSLDAGVAVLLALPMAWLAWNLVMLAVYYKIRNYRRFILMQAAFDALWMIFVCHMTGGFFSVFILAFVLPAIITTVRVSGQWGGIVTGIFTGLMWVYLLLLKNGFIGQPPIKGASASRSGMFFALTGYMVLTWITANFILRRGVSSGREGEDRGGERRLGEMFAGGPEFDRVLTGFGRMARLDFAFRQVIVYMLDERAETFITRLEADPGGENFQRMNIPLSGESLLFRRAISEKKIFNITDSSMDSRVHGGSIEPGGMSSFVIVPLLVRRLVLGILIGDTTGMKEGLDGTQIKRLLNYANQGAVNLENAMIGARLKRQARKVELANIELQDKVLELSAVYGTMRLLDFSRDSRDVYRSILDGVVRLSGSASGMLIVPSKGSDAWDCRAWTGMVTGQVNAVMNRLRSGGRLTGDLLRGIGMVGAQVVQLALYKRSRGYLVLVAPEKEPFAEKVTDLVKNVSHAVAMTIDNLRMYDELHVADARNRSEMSLARHIQQRLLDLDLNAFPEFDTSVVFFPAREIGGDFYLFIRQGSGAAMVVIGDVAGHGIPAALIMALATSLISDLARTGYSPGELLERANRILCDYLGDDGANFLGVLAARIDAAGRMLTCARAGHAPLLVFDSDSVREVVPDGPILGMFREARYPEETLDVREGQRLVFYTDGIVEARNSELQPYGQERLRRILRKTLDTSPSRASTSVMDNLKNFTKTVEFFDDLTMVIVDLVGTGDLASREKGQFRMPARKEEVPGAVARILASLDLSAYGPGAANEARVAISEAIVNAVQHGNRDDPKKHVTVSWTQDSGSFSIRVEDEGEGFDHEVMRKGPPDTLHDRGRGLMFMEQLMDEVIYEPPGNAVRLIRRVTKHRDLKKGGPQGRSKKVSDKPGDAS